MNLTIVDYTDLSYAVFGNTELWRTQLLELGGKFNPNLRAGKGWIFSKSNGNIQRLQSLVQQINEGRIAPNNVAPIYPRNNYTGEHYNNLPTFNINYAPTPSTSNIIQNPNYVATPRYNQTYQQSNNNQTYTGVQIPTNISTTYYQQPKLETANNTIEEYQTITYRLQKPIIGQKVIIKDGEDYREYVVTNVENNGSFIHSFYIKQVRDGSLTRVIIKDGKWTKDTGEVNKQTFFFY